MDLQWLMLMVPAFEERVSEREARMRERVELEAKVRDREDRHEERMTSTFAVAYR